MGSSQKEKSQLRGIVEGVHSVLVGLPREFDGEKLRLAARLLTLSLTTAEVLRPKQVVTFSISNSGLKTLDSFFGVDYFTAFESSGVTLTDLELAQFGEYIEGELSRARGVTLQTILEEYRLLLDDNEVSREGVFYTPYSVIQRMTRNAIEMLTAEEVRSCTILDPACGSGLFLLEAYRVLVKTLSPHAPLTTSERLGVLTESIFGSDKDPVAIALARIALISEAYSGSQEELFPPRPPSHQNINLYCGNSLIDSEICALRHTQSAESLSPVPLTEISRTLTKRGGFDIVIGNPPYGLSRDNKISPEENEILRTLYDGTLSGRVNKYMLFMARALQLVRPLGIVSLLTPNSWCGIKEGAGIRKLLLRDGSLTSIDRYNYTVFASAGVEVVTVTARKGAGARTITISEIANTGKTSRVHRVPTTLCLETPGHRIHLSWSPDHGRFLKCVRDTTVGLGSSQSWFLPRIALQAYAVGKGVPAQTPEQVAQHIYHARSRQDASYHPYLEGSDVKRYRTEWSGSYLKHGPCLAEPQTLERFTGPRIVIREIIARPPYVLSAAFVTGTCLYNKSVLHILPKEDTSEELLWALVGILNSSFAGLYFGHFGRKSARSMFPKLVADDLKDFPVPKMLPQIAPCLAAFAQSIAGLYVDSTALGNVLQPVTQDIPPDTLRSRQKDLDQAVSAAYNISHATETRMLESLATL